MSSDPFLTSDDSLEIPSDGSSHAGLDVANCETELLSQILDELGAESEQNDDGCVVSLSEDVLRKLQHIFPDTLLLAALDLIDRECVIKYTTPWGRVFYRVRGSTDTYVVQPSLDANVSAFCSCPSFMYAVLMHEEHSVCKHVLAVKLAQRLGRYATRNVDEEGVKNILTS